MRGILFLLQSILYSGGGRGTTNQDPAFFIIRNPSSTLHNGETEKKFQIVLCWSMVISVNYMNLMILKQCLMPTSPLPTSATVLPCHNPK